MVPSGAGALAARAQELLTSRQRVAELLDDLHVAEVASRRCGGGHGVRGKVRADHAGDLEDMALVCRQTLETRLDDRTEPVGNRRPYSLDVAAKLPAAVSAARASVLQQVIEQRHHDERASVASIDEQGSSSPGSSRVEKSLRQIARDVLRCQPAEQDLATESLAQQFALDADQPGGRARSRRPAAACRGRAAAPARDSAQARRAGRASSSRSSGRPRRRARVADPRSARRRSPPGCGACARRCPRWRRDAIGSAGRRPPGSAGASGARGGEAPPRSRSLGAVPDRGQGFENGQVGLAATVLLDALTARRSDSGGRPSSPDREGHVDQGRLADSGLARDEHRPVVEPLVAARSQWRSRSSRARPRSDHERHRSGERRRHRRCARRRGPIVATKRYPRRGTVSTKRGAVGSSPSAARSSTRTAARRPRSPRRPARPRREAPASSPARPAAPRGCGGRRRSWAAGHRRAVAAQLPPPQVELEWWEVDDHRGHEVCRGSDLRQVSWFLRTWGEAAA